MRPLYKTSKAGVELGYDIGKYNLKDLMALMPEAGRRRQENLKPFLELANHPFKRFSDWSCGILTQC
ncbi:MAG: hypothetical protein LBT01_07710 [Spirochaetaceae bacterium]|jgi:hypothetical protein|nr:hypothetical protein [Spirochaetaceae bacterium]